MRTADGGLTQATIAASQRRILRLLGALDDLASYSAPLSESRMLVQAWSRLSEVLLLHAAELERASSRHDAALWPGGQTLAVRGLRQAVARVGTLPTGSLGWWLAVHEVSDLCSRDLVRSSKAAWSAGP